MSKRPKVGDFLNIHSRPVLSTGAEVIDTYQRPTIQGRSKGEALSAALSGLDQAFSPVLAKGIRQQATRDHEKGEELFQKNRKDFAEAVRNGDIPMGASPFVRRGYRESQLHVLGATYNVELKRALEHSNLSEVDNPAEVEEFVQAFNEKYREENNIGDMPAKEVNRIFTPLVVQSNDNFRNSQAAQNIQLVEERRFRSFEQELHLAVTQGRFSGPEGSASADAKNLSQWLNARAQEMYEEGIDYKLIEKSILRSVGEAAAQNGSIGIAGVLNNIEVAGMGSLGNSEAGRKVKSQVRKIASAREAARNRAAKASVASASKATVRDLQARAQAAARDGDHDTAQALLTQLNSVDPVKARAVDGFIRRYEGDLEDAAQDGAFSQALEAVRSAGSVESADNAINEAIIYGNLDPTDAGRLESIAERQFTPPKAGDPLGLYEGDKFLTSTASSIKDHFPRSEFGQVDPQYADKVSRAEAEYEDAMIDWVQKNTNEDGNFDRLEARKAAQAAKSQAVETYSVIVPQSSNGGGEEVTDPNVPLWATE